jgi:hypothetical protein
MLTLNPKTGITDYNGAVQTFNNRSLSPFLKKDRYKMMQCSQPIDENGNNELKKSLESLRTSTI